jgi:hypothetical protein
MRFPYERSFKGRRRTGEIYRTSLEMENGNSTGDKQITRGGRKYNLKFKKGTLTYDQAASDVQTKDRPPNPKALLHNPHIRRILLPAPASSKPAAQHGQTGQIRQRELQVVLRGVILIPEPECGALLGHGVPRHQLDGDASGAEVPPGPALVAEVGLEDLGVAGCGAQGARGEGECYGCPGAGECGDALEELCREGLEFGQLAVHF